GNWDASLLLVMLGAVVVAWIGYRIALKRSRPVLADQFYIPTKIKIDKPLVVGSVIFVIGWGFSGYCPGPGIAAAGFGIMDAVYFVLGLIIGKIVLTLFEK